MGRTIHSGGKKLLVIQVALKKRLINNDKDSQKCHILSDNPLNNAAKESSLSQLVDKETKGVDIK